MIILINLIFRLTSFNPSLNFSHIFRVIFVNYVFNLVITDLSISNIIPSIHFSLIWTHLNRLVAWTECDLIIIRIFTIILVWITLDFHITIEHMSDFSLRSMLNYYNGFLTFFICLLKIFEWLRFIFTFRPTPPGFLLQLIFVIKEFFLWNWHFDCILFI